jgi:hypothetical protein
MYRVARYGFYDILISNVILQALMTEVVSAYEMSVNMYHATRRSIPEGNNLFVETFNKLNYAY